MKRSKFSLSHTKLFSCDMGELVPCGLVEVLPGDSIQHGVSALVRAAPLVTPVMHPVEVRVHHWFVPFRLIWEDWENFITGGPNGTDASVFPTVGITAGIAQGTLANYLGIPVMGAAAGLPPISALPFRAYDLIWNDWYRDQDLESPVTIDLTSGPDTTSNFQLLNCDWEKDYLTSARPWEQKGPAITIPIGTTAPVVTNGLTPHLTSGALANRDMQFGPGNQLRFSGADIGAVATAQFGDQSGLQVNLAGVSSVTVNLLREAMALQRFEEARARYGSRYVEYLRYLGVRSSDARLQRPEYLGGVRQMLQFSEVLQTAPGADPVGEMKGHGIAGMRGRRYRRFFEEHGYVLSLMSVRPKTIYMNSIQRTWNRRTKEDFYQKELEHIGQQEVLNKEARGNHATPDGIFGYQDRYDEYRRMESSVAGEFATSTLNTWHMARDFATDPALNATFVKCVPTERTFAVPAEDVIYVQMKHSIQARRLLAQTGRSYIY